MNAYPFPPLPGALQQRSALGTTCGAAAVVVHDGADVRIVEEPFLPLTSLRLSRRLDPAELPAAFAQAPNRFTGNAEGSVARFEPRAWLLLGDVAATPLPDGLRPVDLSARLAAFRLSGGGAESILRASTSVVPPIGGFVRSFFAESYAVLLQRLDTQEFRLLVDVSLAVALAGWLADAARLTTAP